MTMLPSRAGDAELHVTVQGPDGEEPPVVCIHGWADSGEVWRGVADELGRTNRVWTWDLRGHGRSSVPPPARYTRALALQDLATVVAAAGEPCVLAGHSLGGYLALAHAILSPDAVAALVLVGAGPGFRNPEAMARWNASVDRSAADLGGPRGQEEIAKHVDSMVLDRLSEITCPVAVVLGERDERFAASAEVFAAHLDVRIRSTVPGAGHRVHLTAPTAVAGAIRDLLAVI